MELITWESLKFPRKVRRSVLNKVVINGTKITTGQEAAKAKNTGGYYWVKFGHLSFATHNACKRSGTPE